MKALVTGATGFIGSFLIEWLLEQNVEVGIVLRPGSDPWRLSAVLNRIKVISGDIADVDALTEAFIAFSPDVVYHSAWAGVGNHAKSGPEQIEQNLIPTIKLARLAVSAGCSAFVGLGSQAEYGPHSEPIDESMMTTPSTMYGSAKLSAYHLCRTTLLDTGVRFAWIRVFSTYGPKDNLGWMTPYLIKCLLNTDRPALTGGAQIWDFLYVTDAAEAIGLVGMTNSAHGVFNLGSGKPILLKKYIEQLRNYIDPTLALGFGEVPYRSDQVMRLEPKIDKLRNSIDWNPRISIEMGLRETIHWFKNL